MERVVRRLQQSIGEQARTVDYWKRQQSAGRAARAQARLDLAAEELSAVLDLLAARSVFDRDCAEFVNAEGICMHGGHDHG